MTGNMAGWSVLPFTEVDDHHFDHHGHGRGWPVGWSVRFMFRIPSRTGPLFTWAWTGLDQ